MDIAVEVGLFLAKFFAAAVIIVAAIGAVIALLARARGGESDDLKVTHLNRRFERMALTLQSAILPPKAYKASVKQAEKEHKAAAKHPDTERHRVFVCHFEGDVRASAVHSLREEITAILSVATAGDEVLITIESPGGMVTGYGLAASQLKRIRDHGITLTAAIDKVAASGGYMMACVADHIIAAPFAVVGSIGVVAQMPNFNRVLKKNDIDYEQVTAGEYKRTLTLFGENTDEDRRKFQEEIDDVHALFKEFVAEHRPVVDIDAIATGEHWFGRRALDKALVDSLQTSDDYLVKKAQVSDIYEVSFEKKKNWMERLTTQARLALRGV